MTRKRAARPCAWCGHSKEAHEKKGPCRVGHEATGPDDEIIEYDGKKGTRAHWRAVLGLPKPCECPGYTTKERPMIDTKKTSGATEPARTRVFELAGGALLVIPEATPHRIVTGPPTLQGGNPERQMGELEIALARWTKLRTAIDEVKLAPLPALLADVKPRSAHYTIGEQDEIVNVYDPPPRPVSTSFSREEPAVNEYQDGSHAPLVSLGMSKLRRSLLIVLAQCTAPIDQRRLLLRAGYRSSGDTSTELAALVREELGRRSGAGYEITDAGRAVIGPVPKLPQGKDLAVHLLRTSKLSTVEQNIFAVFVQRPASYFTRTEALELADYASSGDTSTAFAKLVRLGYLEKHGARTLRLAKELRE